MQKGNKSKNTNNILNIDNITINTTKSLELLGVTIDSKLNFEEQISIPIYSIFYIYILYFYAVSSILTSAIFLLFGIYSVMYSNFSYFPLVKSSNKIEQIQKYCLRIILNDYKID